jgi:hypothetical protein
MKGEPQGVGILNKSIIVNRLITTQAANTASSSVMHSVPGLLLGAS